MHNVFGEMVILTPNRFAYVKISRETFKVDRRCDYGQVSDMDIIFREATEVSCATKSSVFKGTKNVI